MLIFVAQGERNYIMQVVCEATQSSSLQVQVGAFECLVRIMTLYYEKMSYYMERALFGVSHCIMRYDCNLIAQSVSAYSDGYETHGRVNSFASH